MPRLRRERVLDDAKYIGLDFLHSSDSEHEVASFLGIERFQNSRCLFRIQKRQDQRDGLRVFVADDSRELLRIGIP